MEHVYESPKFDRKPMEVNNTDSAPATKYYELDPQQSGNSSCNPGSSNTTAHDTVDRLNAERQASWKLATNNNIS